MNRNKLKTYAPSARRDFIQAVKDRAVMYGLSAKKIEPMTERGDVVLIAGQPFPKTVASKRKRLEERIAAMGFERAMEAIAYSWFNRFVAIRFMELHGYLDHGYRVLSHPSGDVQPEILEHAQRVDFPGLDKNKVVELKLDGTKQEELYRLLLVAQCNALSQAMPFLFERIDDETELLLPGNLLATDSLIQNLVKEIDEEDWKEVEIIGWLYQFYISERKDEVIGKVVASEDIPAATQLFTPNWIVKYLVQNTLGRIWLATYPQSGIRQQMEFYIEPAEQTPEVQEQLKAITPTSLNPEELTLLDPACGSAHILVEAYELFKAIYQERGYRAKDIPGLILGKNLYGLEIDDRAAQLAAFALLMKARVDDRRILESGIQPNILAFVESKGMDAGAITHALNTPIKDEKAPPSEYLLEEVEEAEMPLLKKKRSGVTQPHVAVADISALLSLFEEAKTFGSLIQVPVALAAKLPAIEDRVATVLKDGDLTHAQAAVIAPLLRQATVLNRQYDAVVANPPYMGLRVLNGTLKVFLKTHYGDFKIDLFTSFISRCVALAQASGDIGLMSPHVWMYLSTHQPVRELILSQTTITNLVELPPNGFKAASVQISAYTLTRRRTKGVTAKYVRLVSLPGDDEDMAQQVRHVAAGGHTSLTSTRGHDYFSGIAGTPICYWISTALKNAFGSEHTIGSLAAPKHGMTTFDNARFLRMWQEVSVATIKWDAADRQEAVNSRCKWFPYRKGGGYRKWYGNTDLVINWQGNGREIKEFIKDKNPNVACGESYFFREGVSWSDVSKTFAVRHAEKGALFDVKGASAFPAPEDRDALLALMNSNVIDVLLQILNPTATSQVGDIARIPASQLSVTPGNSLPDVGMPIDLSRRDWDSFERSHQFRCNPLLAEDVLRPTLKGSYEEWLRLSRGWVGGLKEWEEENNRRLIGAFGLHEDLTSHVPLHLVSLTVNPAYRYTKRVDDKQWVAESGLGEELELRFRSDTCAELLSYAVGCMMGRYSLDKEGLIYAHSGNEGFDPSQYARFPADDDGIVPVTEAPWFDEDAANRFERFVKTVWPSEKLEENLAFVAESLGVKKSETPRETIRRYFAGDFYKHHLQAYKNRPIYWLFSSGKQGAFEALVYLHRYNEGTLSRMRTEYVVPLMGKMNGRLGMLADTIAKATSSKQRKDAEKEKDKLTKQLAELQAFDEQLRHYADQRITLDLDDGVRMNYGKFGDLLADVKKVCGKAEEE